MDRTGKKVATASEKGTVIRVFSIPEGKRLFEFRRGVARCATISSLNFSPEANFLSVSSNTQTIHIFKLVNVQEQVDLNISEPILTLFEELKWRTKQWLGKLSYARSSISSELSPFWSQWSFTARQRLCNGEIAFLRAQEHQVRSPPWLQKKQFQPF